MNRKKGFTLIELLVVIAIIGILATVVLVSLNSARAKARDTRRLSDLRQTALALEMYANDNSGLYPVSATCTNATFETMANTLVTGGYLSAVPQDPTDVAPNQYYYGATSSNYILKATLENANNDAFDSDIDSTTVGGCTCADASLFYCTGP